ncbi:MAG: hypothetical protein JWN18_46 [Parcubacteria group bacterium]|nr:hypothetical protein [Parcubacteria group bacterium]
MFIKARKILINAFPVALMIILIPIVLNDFLLAALYLVIAIISLMTRHEKNDYLAYVFGLVVITISEYFFIQTGVETFMRNSLFGIMPVWLPLLWAYAFVAIMRSLRVLDQ